MGWLMAEYFLSASQLLDSGTLKEGDIIEFNRISYSHFGIYIGSGICVNVTGPEAGGISSSSSSSSSKKFDKGMKQAESLLKIAGHDPERSKVRVNNGVIMASIHGFVKRPKHEAIAEALEGLPTNRHGDVILEAPIPYDYQLLNNNCEYFATRCKYYGDRFSVQVLNPCAGSTIGTIERLASAQSDEIGHAMVDKDANLADKFGASLEYTYYTTLEGVANMVKTTSDVAVGLALYWPIPLCIGVTTAARKLLEIF